MNVSLSERRSRRPVRLKQVSTGFLSATTDASPCVVTRSPCPSTARGNTCAAGVLRGRAHAGARVPREMCPGNYALEIIKLGRAVGRSAHSPKRLGTGRTSSGALCQCKATTTKGRGPPADAPQIWHGVARWVGFAPLSHMDRLGKNSIDSIKRTFYQPEDTPTSIVEMPSSHIIKGALGTCHRAWNALARAPTPQRIRLSKSFCPSVSRMSIKNWFHSCFGLLLLDVLASRSGATPGKRVRQSDRLLQAWRLRISWRHRIDSV